MRITNRMLQQSLLRDLRANLETLARAQRQAASGRRIATLSDDPVDAVRVMRMESELRDIEQFRRNAAAATTRLSAEDAVLESVRELLERARHIALSAASLPPGDPQRDTALAEVRFIREQIIALGNTQVGNEYIFGGGQTTTPPFRPDGTYVGDMTRRQTAIDERVIVDVNSPGAPVLTDALQALQGLTVELQTGDDAAIRAVVADLGRAADQALTVQTLVGARLRAITESGEHLDARAVDLLDGRQGLRDADPAVSLLELAAAQAALERAYAVIGRIHSASLVDYLR